MPAAEQFWNKIAEKYAASPIKDMESYEATLARTRAHLTPEDRVLEVGCGTGTTALKLAPSVGHITASDASASMVEIGRRKADETDAANAEFVLGTLEGDTLPKGPFDAVLAFNLLHLVDDLPAALREIHARVKPGGLFISKTPCLGSIGPLMRMALPLLLVFMRARYRTEPPSPEFFTADDLERTVRDAGFEIVEAAAIPEGKASHFVVARKI